MRIRPAQWRRAPLALSPTLPTAISPLPLLGPPKGLRCIFWPDPAYFPLIPMWMLRDGVILTFNSAPNRQFGVLIDDGWEMAAGHEQLVDADQ
jgi:hypothetical protein